jgi:GntR family transcriptional regulator
LIPQSELPESDVINKDSPLPLYHQLMEKIRQEIESGNWQPGQLIPSEAELCKTHDISRAVVRQALKELEYQGFLIRKQGKGTYVAKPAISYHLAQRLLGFYEDMVSKGTKPISKVLKQEVIKATGDVATQLEIKPGEDVIAIERLRLVNDEPIVLVMSYLPNHLCPGLINENLRANSLYELLEGKFGLKLTHGYRTIMAVAADSRQSNLLGIKKGSPLISFDGVTYLEDGRPIEWYQSVHRGDRGKFIVRLRREM